MFRVSTKGDYGLLVLVAIAEKMRDGDSRVSLKKIAQAKCLSLSYISQIIIPLKQAGLVESKEGKNGGYSLAKPANKITMMEILEALEGPVSPVQCCSKKNAKCGREAYCGVKFAWQDAKNAMVRFLRTRTLEEVLKAQNSKFKKVKI